MSASEDEDLRVVVLEWMGPDHTRKRVSIEPLEERGGRWRVRWEWRRDDGGWETMQATEATETPDVAPNVGESAS